MPLHLSSQKLIMFLSSDVYLTPAQKMSFMSCRPFHICEVVFLLLYFLFQTSFLLYLFLSIWYTIIPGFSINFHHHFSINFHHHFINRVVFFCFTWDIPIPPWFLLLQTISYLIKLYDLLMCPIHPHKNLILISSFFILTHVGNLYTEDWYKGIAESTKLINTILPPNERNLSCPPSSFFYIFYKSLPIFFCQFISPYRNPQVFYW